MKDLSTQLAILTDNVAEIIPLDTFKAKLETAIQTQVPLRVKFGADPSRPDLHLGHTVVLRKLRQFQDCGHHIDFIIGDATNLIPTLNENWDMVFIDADKKNYLNYYELVISSVKSGGYIIADNVLWSGKVVEKEHDDEDTQALRVFNDTLSKDSRLEVVLLPVRDGLLIARKI